ncbi:piggyBac transposable element-derived protein 4-like [Discoglossus pictus]
MASKKRPFRSKENSDSELETLAKLSDSDSWENSASDTESDDSDDSATELSNVRTWCSIYCCTDQVVPPRFPFTGASGMKVDGKHDNPLAYLKLFLTEEVIEKHFTETNRYKEQQLATLHWKFSKTRKCKPVTKDDIWKFLGLIILLGVMGKPLQKWYWTTNKLLATPFFGMVMWEYRFSLIMKFLHFENNEEFDGTTYPAPKLKKIWEVSQMILKNLQWSYVPERDISIDESLMAYKRRISWVQYIALKRALVGVKSYMLCESTTTFGI